MRSVFMLISALSISRSMIILSFSCFNKSCSNLFISISNSLFLFSYSFFETFNLSCFSLVLSSVFKESISSVSIFNSVFSFFISVKSLTKIQDCVLMRVSSISFTQDNGILLHSFVILFSSILGIDSKSSFKISFRLCLRAWA